MKRMLLALALALAASPALTEESKSIATQVGDAIRPAAEAYGKGMQKLVNELFAGSKAPWAKPPEPTSKPKINENAKPIAGFVAP